MTLRKTFLGEEKKRDQSSADRWVFPGAEETKHMGRLVVAGEWPSETSSRCHLIGKQYGTVGYYPGLYCSTHQGASSDYPIR